MRLLLVDGHYYVYRSFYAIRGLTTSRGEPVNAIYGFVKTVRRMVKDLAPELGAVIWDLGPPARRLALQPEYKQQRPEMPESMAAQLGCIQEFVPLLGFQSLAIENIEADDLIAAYARAAAACGHDVVLATNDKDLFQLVGDRVRIYSTAKTDLASPKDTHALLGAREVREKWGVEPARIADVLCLVGDPVDNIRGVEGIGLKTAVALVQEHGGVEAILKNPDAIANPRLREKIRSAAARIAQNREMVLLDDTVPLPVPIEALHIAPRYDKLMAALARCEFKSLLEEVRKEAERTKTVRQPELF